MNHLVTERYDTHTTLRYHDAMLGYDENGSPLMYDLEATRIWAGVSFPDAAMQSRKTGHGYGVVVAERTYPSRSNMPDERVYILIDETESNTATALFDEMIRLKDRYCITLSVCADEPVHLAQAFARLEGLSWYHKEMHRVECKQRWDSFKDKTVISGVRQVKMPNAESAHRGIENLLASNARNPNTGEEILGADDKPIPRLYLPSGFKNKIARQEITTESMPEVSQALWMVLQEMEKSRPPKPKVEREPRNVNRITGY